MIPFSTFKKILSIISYAIVPALLLSFLVYGRLALDETTMKHISVSFGTIAFLLVAINLFAKPLSRFFPSVTLFHNYLMVRRQVGVTAFYFAISHVLGLFLSTEIFSHIGSWISDIKGPLLPGFVAVIFMIILGLTSNNFSTFRLKRNWKRVQYIAYPTFILVLFHVGGFKGSVVPAIVMSSFFIIIKVLEFKGFVILKKKK